MHDDNSTLVTNTGRTSSACNSVSRSATGGTWSDTSKRRLSGKYSPWMVMPLMKIRGAATPGKILADLIAP